MAAMFAHFRLPGWGMYSTGAIEVIGAAAILSPFRTGRVMGGLLLSATMICAAGFHLAYDPPAAASPAVILAALTALIAYKAYAAPLATPDAPGTEAQQG